MIRLQKINKVYNNGKSNEFQALYDITLSINEGELISIIGKSGSGKTSLINIIGCIDKSTSGNYMIDNVNVSKISMKEYASIRNSKFGIVMQDFALIETYTVKENLLIPVLFSKRRLDKKDLENQIDELLTKLDILKLKNKDVVELSGGQKQRTAIARALINNPPIILADEPTGALDSRTSSEIMQLFKELNKEGKTIIIVTHDMEIAKQCDRIIEIADGRIIN